MNSRSGLSPVDRQNGGAYPGTHTWSCSCGEVHEGTRAEKDAGFCENRPEGSASRPPPSVRDAWRIFNDVEVLSLPDPVYAIKDVVVKESVIVVYSPPGVGKTTLATSMVVSLASGRNWFGHQVVSRGPCLMVPGEDVSGTKQRLIAAKRAHGLSLQDMIGVHTFPAPIDLLDASQVSRFIETVRKKRLPQLAVIVFDTYAAMTPGANENSSEAATLAMTHAHHIKAELAATVMFCHHTNAAGNRERGHSAMRGAADTMISMTLVDDVVHVECSKQRNGPPFETLRLKLAPVPGTNAMVFRAADDVLPSATLSPLQAKLLGVLREGSTGGRTTAEWRAACQDVVERSFYRAVGQLEDKGFIRKDGSHFRVLGGSSND